jgi:hypothetical protein
MVITKPIVLNVTSHATAPLLGRVLTPSGKPLAGAMVRLWRQAKNTSGRLVVLDPVLGADGSTGVLTDGRGLYRAPRQVPLKREYYAEATAPGRLTARSPAVILNLSTTDQRLPDLVLTGLRRVSGLVIDRESRLVAMATVRQSGDGPLRTEARTDEQGRFQLPGVAEGPVFVFAGKEGFRFQVLPIDGRDSRSTVKVTLTRSIEPPATAYKTLASRLSPAEEKALAKRLVFAHADGLLTRGKDDPKYRWLIDAIQVDPFAVLERFESITFVDPDLLNYARIQLVQSLAQESLDEALDQAEACPNPDTRASCYLGICDERPDLGKTPMRKLIDQALLNTRAMKSLSDRVIMVCRIADKLVDLSERDLARKMLHEAEELARPMVRSARGGGLSLTDVAESLSRLDLPAAVKMLEDLASEIRKNDTRDRGYVFARVYGRIAYKLAAELPADAERLMRQSAALDRNTWRYLCAVCSRMAAKDPVRARRIAETAVPPDWVEFRPYAYGLMAQSLAPTDKGAACRLIEDAYTELDRQVTQGQSTIRSNEVMIAAGLLPIVEQIAPDRLSEFLARTLALRSPRGETSDEDRTARETAALAIMIARYDRSLAARILQPDRPPGEPAGPVRPGLRHLASPGRRSPDRPRADRRTNRASTPGARSE